jgi:hypothetical protein
MVIEDFTTGPYTGTYNSQPLGLSRDGYRINHETRQQNIEQSDAYGDALLDYVTRGGNVSVSFTMQSFKKAIAATVLWPTAPSIYTLYTTATPIGRLASALAKVLVLTVVPNTPAAAVGFGPSTITAEKAILAPGHSFEQLFDSRLREIPIRLSLLPYSNPATLAFAGPGGVCWAVTT